MNQEAAQLNIYQKMLKATELIERVKKNLKVEMGKGGSYKAVGEGDVLAAVKPVEIELGIYSYPFDRSVIETQTLTVIKEYNGNKTESNQLFMRIETIYRFVNVNDPKDYLDIKSYGDGVDSQDKAPGKAMTYADKYALLKGYKIETGDDPDKEGSGELKGAQGKTIPLATPNQIATLRNAYVGDNLTKLLQFNKLSKLEDMTMSKASELIGILKAKEESK